MLQNISKSFSPVTVSTPEVTSEPMKAAVLGPVYTAISYGDAAQLLGLTMMSQYGVPSVAALSAADRQAARNFGAALESLASV